MKTGKCFTLLLIQFVLLGAGKTALWAVIVWDIQDSDTSETRWSVTLKNGERVEVRYPRETFLNLSDAEIREWICDQTSAVEQYYGQFPVRQLNIRLRPVSGKSSLSYGNAFPGNPPRINIFVGTEVSKKTMLNTWVLIHEMTHLAFPSLPDEQRWMEEGMATYIEPIIRVEAGIMSIEDLWKELMENTPKAVLGYSTGLDDTRSFDRLYWGGALFWLLTDIQLRKETGNRIGLKQVFRHILQRGGDISSDWAPKELLQRVNTFTKTSALEILYKKMGANYFAPDLSTLWSDLGIHLAGQTVVFDNNSELAAIRQQLCRLPQQQKLRVTD